MMKVSYKNSVPAVSLRQDDGYTAVYPSLPARVPESGCVRRNP